MKTKLLKTLCLIIAAFGLNSLYAQNYKGTPFTGTAIQIGTAVGVGNKLEIENFDRIAGNINGANYIGDTTNPIDPTLGEEATYYDSTPGNSGTSSYRSTSSVDLSDSDGSSGVFLTGNQGQEFQMFTVNVVQSGSYTATVNYRHSGANKRFQVYIYPTDLSTSTVILNANANNPALPRTDGSGTAIFLDSAPTTAFDLTAGTWIIRTRILDATWDIDYLTFTLQSVLSTNKFDSSSIYIANPVKNELAINGLPSNVKEVSVFNLLGKSVLQNKVNNQSSSLSFDVSNLTTGIYIVKISGEFGSYTRKFVKQ